MLLSGLCHDIITPDFATKHVSQSFRGINHIIIIIKMILSLAVYAAVLPFSADIGNTSTSSLFHSSSVHPINYIYQFLYTQKQIRQV